MTTWVRNVTSSQKTRVLCTTSELWLCHRVSLLLRNFCSFWEGQENPERNPTQIYLVNNMSAALNLGLGVWIQMYMTLTDRVHSQEGISTFVETQTVVFSVAHWRTGKMCRGSDHSPQGNSLLLKAVPRLPRPQSLSKPSSACKKRPKMVNSEQNSQECW